MVKNTRLVTIRKLQPCLMTSLTTVCDINGNFYIKFVHTFDIIKKTNVWSQKNLLTNATKMNEHSNFATFVHALLANYASLCLCLEMKNFIS